MANETVVIEIRPSTIIRDEVGLFCVLDLDCDEIVISSSEFEVTFQKWDELENLDAATKEKVMAFCPGRVDGYLAPKNIYILSIAWYMNHSCDPNIGFDRDYNFVAMKDIGAGEELLWDYAYDESNPNFKLLCQCGTKDCRGTVTGSDWVKYRNLNFHKRYISPHLIKLIDSQ